MSPAAASRISTRCKPSNAKSLVTLVRLYLPIELGDGHIVAELHAAIEDPADRDPPQIVARIEIRDEQLQRGRGVTLRCRRVLQNRFEQRSDGLPRDRGDRGWRFRPSRRCTARETRPARRWRPDR